jgi:hypothetical protein
LDKAKQIVQDEKTHQQTLPATLSDQQRHHDECANPKIHEPTPVKSKESPYGWLAYMSIGWVHQSMQGNDLGPQPIELLLAVAQCPRCQWQNSNRQQKTVGQAACSIAERQSQACSWSFGAH